jgi:hypothetical protein
MLQSVFGDDEHTASEGTYQRLMKTRKWLYLTSALAIVMSQGLYDEEAAKALLQVVAAPEWLIRGAVKIALGYLLLLYSLLFLQLATTYDIIWRERLFKSAREKDRSASIAVEAANRELSDAAGVLNRLEGPERVGDSAYRAAELRVERARSARNTALAEYAAVQRDDPTRRPNYAATEMMIDAIRILPPIVFGFIAFGRLAG